MINKLPGESSEFPELDRAGKTFTVNRLDTPVSGCQLLAKTREAAAFLNAEFSNHVFCGNNQGKGRVKKRYWAIIEAPDSETFMKGEWKELVHWIAPLSGQNKSIAFAKEKLNAKKASLFYRLAGKGDRYLFVEVDLVTGRHHQIRAQFVAEGLHIKGDLKYGSKRSERGGGIRLHAFSLAFPNPLNPTEMIKAKALPPTMDALWEAFAEVAEVIL